MRYRKKYLKQLRSIWKNALNVELLIKRQIVISKLHEYANESLIQDSCVNSDQSEIVVSLTSYDKRIYEVYLVIESLLHQTIKPYKIILWLSKDEFCYDDLPIILKKQQNRGLEIKFCDDLKSYKKLLPTLREYSSYDIVTVDDDFIYPYDFIENLLKTHIKNPNCICYYRGARMSLKNGKIQPYLQWCNSEKEYIPSILNFATGCGGILYPIGCFNASVFDENLIFELAPYADDIWFKSMALLNGVKYVKVQHPIAFEDKFIPLESMQDIALYHQNVNQNRNDVQMQAVFEYFKLLLEE